MRHATVAISDTSFTGPVRRFDVTGSGTWVDARGSRVTYKWFEHPTNRQGASTAFDTPGILLDTFNSKGTNPLRSFSVDLTGAVSDSGPFSMTLQATGVLSPGASLLDRGQTEVKTPIPEPSTWAMLGLLGDVGPRLRGDGFGRSDTPQEGSPTRVLNNSGLFRHGRPPSGGHFRLRCVQQECDRSPGECIRTEATLDKCA